MIESGLSLPDLRDVEEYHDDRKLAKMFRSFRQSVSGFYVQSQVLVQVKVTLVTLLGKCLFFRLHRR